MRRRPQAKLNHSGAAVQGTSRRRHECRRRISSFLFCICLSKEKKENTHTHPIIRGGPGEISRWGARPIKPNPNSTLNPNWIHTRHNSWRTTKRIATRGLGDRRVFRLAAPIVHPTFVHAWVSIAKRTRALLGRPICFPPQSQHATAAPCLVEPRGRVAKSVPVFQTSSSFGAFWLDFCFTNSLDS